MSDANPPEDQRGDDVTHVHGWLEAEDGVEIADDTITVAGDPEILLTLTIDDERVSFNHERAEEGMGADRAGAVIAAFPDRGTTLRATTAVDRTGVSITLTNHVYRDGLNRQSIVTALNEIVAGADRISALGAAPIEATEVLPFPPVSDPMDEASEAPTIQQPPWAPTHVVPSDGMRAWSEPDPSLQPISRLDGGAEVVVTERRGDWAKVLGSNGWTGWVDARELTQPEASPRGTMTVGGLHMHPLLVLGGSALVASTFLPWVSRLGVSTNAMDIPLSFLWDFTSSGDPQLGWLVAALGVITLGLAFTRRPPSSVVVIVGILAVTASVAFVVQMYRGLGDVGDGSLFEWLGFAPWVALGGGIVNVASSATR